jgi:hypothetical protein
MCDDLVAQRQRPPERRKIVEDQRYITHPIAIDNAQAVIVKATDLHDGLSLPRSTARALCPDRPGLFWRRFDGFPRPVVDVEVGFFR